MRRLLDRRRIADSGCWEYTHSVDRHGGYGRIRCKQFPSVRSVPRIAAWIWLNFDPTSEWRIGHTCENAKCFNPEHLLAATRSDVSTRGESNEKNRTLSVNERAFDVLTPEALYWIGFLYADGYIPASRSYIRIALGAVDVGHLEKFRTFLGAQAAVVTKREPCSIGQKLTHDVSRFEVNSTRINTRLRKLGLGSPKPSRDRLPTELTASRDFWRGVIDGDGCLGIYRYPGTILHLLTLTSDRAIVEQFREFCVGAGVATKRDVKNCGKCYEARLTRAKARQITKVLYDGATVSLSRKAELAQSMMAYNPAEARQEGASRGQQVYVTRYSLSERQNMISTGLRRAAAKRSVSK